MNAPAATAALGAWRESLRGRWRALAQRERRLVGAAVAALALLLVWLVAVQPAWRTLREAPRQLEQLDAELQRMQRLAVESRRLRATPPLPREQSAAALRSASERLGAAGRLSLQGDRAVLTLTNVRPGELRDWLAEARSAARVRPLEVQLSRSATGFSGSITVALAGSAP